MKPLGNRRCCGNCHTVGRCEIRYLPDNNDDSRLEPIWLCARCRALVDEEESEDYDEEEEGIICSNCGCRVCPDEDDTCPECGANVYILGY